MVGGEIFVSDKMALFGHHCRRYNPSVARRREYNPSAVEYAWGHLIRRVRTQKRHY